MPLLLDGAPIPGHDHRVTVQQQIESKELAGETSSTAASHAGWKPTLVRVRLRVNFDNARSLLVLRRLFHQTDTCGAAPATWDINEPTVVAEGLLGGTRMVALLYSEGDPARCHRDHLIVCIVRQYWTVLDSLPVLQLNQGFNGSYR